MMRVQPPPPEASFQDFFTAAGLNRQHVFALADLPENLRATLRPHAGETQLILLAHAGRLLWEKVQAADLPGTDPIDDYTAACVHKFFTAHNISSRLLYPGPAAVNLQAFGRLAGWHHAAPFMVGIDADWGSWFAYRALIVAASDFPLSAVQEKTHPCLSCAATPCIAACPAGALQPEFSLAACADYRLQENSACADNCLARRACPVGREHGYTVAQMRHSYCRSLAALHNWRAQMQKSP